MNIDDVINLSVEGVDTRDYPDFCDAYFAQGFWAETGKELTEDEAKEILKFVFSHLFQQLNVLL